MSLKEFIQKKRKVILIILLILFIIGVLVSFKLISYVIKTNAECISDPFIYSAQRLYEEGMEVNCVCYPLDPHYTSFSFDRYNIIVGEQRSLPISLINNTP